jgi:hypothetical protein
MGKRRGRVVPSVARCSHDGLVSRLRPYVRALALQSPDVSRHAGSVRRCEVCGRWVELEVGLADYRPGVRIRIVSEAYVAQLTTKGARWSHGRYRVLLGPS